MKKRVFYSVVLTLALVIGVIVSYNYYWWIFAKNVKGVVRVRRVTEATAIMGGNNTQPIPASQLYSFAVSVKDSQGEEHTASSEDRQWAVVEDGKCVEAMFFPYPPWDLARAGTFFGARLLKMYDCGPGVATTPAPEVKAGEQPKY